MGAPETPPPPATSSLEELLADARPQLLRILSVWHIPPQDSEDLLHNVFVQFLSKHSDIRTPRAWLAGALRHECAFYWRQRSRAALRLVDQGLLELLSDSSVRPAHARVLRTELRTAFRLLHARCRKILTLRYTSTISAATVASALGVVAVSVNILTRRCVATLARLLITGRGLHPKQRRSTPRPPHT